MSLKSISCACRLRPEVWMWYFSFCARSSAPYLKRMAIAQMRRAGDEPFLDVAHQLEREVGREDAGVLPLVFLEDVRLHRAADYFQGPRVQLRRFVGARLASLAGAEGGQLLVDRGVEEHRQDDRSRAVDGHRHRGGGGAQVEAVVERLHVVKGGDRNPRVADLAPDVGAFVRVAAVERHRIEGGGEPRRRAVARQELEAGVGAERIALA